MQSRQYDWCFFNFVQSWQHDLWFFNFFHNPDNVTGGFLFFYNDNLMSVFLDNINAVIDGIMAFILIQSRQCEWWLFLY